MADITLSVVIPDDKVDAMQSACDLNVSSFTVKVTPYSEFSGNKKAYGAYLAKESLKYWYRSSLNSTDKKSFRAKVIENRELDLG